MIILFCFCFRIKVLLTFGAQKRMVQKVIQLFSGWAVVESHILLKFTQNWSASFLSHMYTHVFQQESQKSSFLALHYRCTVVVPVSSFCTVYLFQLILFDCNRSVWSFVCGNWKLFLGFCFALWRAWKWAHSTYRGWLPHNLTLSLCALLNQHFLSKHKHFSPSEPKSIRPVCPEETPLVGRGWLQQLSM